MPKKNPNGSGMFRKRSNGTWEYRVSYGKDITGKLIQKSFYGATQGICRQKKTEYDSKQVSLMSIQTVGQWAPQWLHLYKKDKCAIDTYNQYKSLVENYIIPELGNLNLDIIKPAHIMQFMNKYGDMSQSHMSKMRMVLNAIFETAIDNDFCSRNPVRNIKAEGIKSKEKAVFSDAELKIISAHCLKERSNISDALLTLLWQAPRREELLGLQWPDIDFENDIITLRRTVIEENGKKKLKETMKNDSSKRAIPMFPQIKKILLSKERTSIFVFPTQNGDFYSPHRFNAAFGRLLQRINRENNANIQILTPHNCRHTCATQMLKQGIDLKIIQQVLGHADITMTGNVYTHTNIDTLKQAVKNFEI